MIKRKPVIQRRNADRWRAVSRKGASLALSGAALSGCAQIIGADFDAKTTDPSYFAGAGNMEPAGGTSSSGGSESGGSESGGSESGGASSGGGDTGGAGSGGGGGTPKNLCENPDDCSAEGVVINEISAQGRPDFIELYNAGDLPADLTGYAITDGTLSPDAGHLSFLPQGTILEPGKFLYLQEEEAGLVLCVLGEDRCLWFEFGISKSGDTVYLMNPDGEVQDSLTYPGEGDDVDDSVTWGRYPDGGEELAPLLPTEKLPNVKA